MAHIAHIAHIAHVTHMGIMAKYYHFSLCLYIIDIFNIIRHGLMVLYYKSKSPIINFVIKCSI